MIVTVDPIVPSHPAFDQVAALFDNYRAHYGRSPAPHATRTWLHDQLTQRRLSMAAAAQGDRICGFVTTTVLPASLLLGTFWWIRDLYVTPQHRRSGIARALLRHVVDDARAAGAQRVSLQTETENAPALTLYEAVGFRPVTGLRQLTLTLAPDDLGEAGGSA